MKYWLIHILVIFSFGQIKAQSQTSLSEQEFQSISDDYKFDKKRWALVPKQQDREQAKVEPKVRPEWGSSGVFDVFGYALIVILIGVILYVIFSNIKIEEKVQPQKLDLDNLDKIEDVDVESGYDMALKDGNYRLALRMQFIKLLQFLNQKKIIYWRNEKTNRDYANEILDTHLKENFAFLSSIFERSWYGNRRIDEAAFDIANAHFMTFFEMEENE